MMASQKVSTPEILDSDGCPMPRPTTPEIPKAKKMPPKKKEKQFWYINGTISYEGNHGSMIFFSQKKLFDTLKKLWAKRGIVQYTGYGPFPLKDLEGFDTQGMTTVKGQINYRIYDESKKCNPKSR